MEAQLIENGILTQSLATVAAMDIYVATTGDDDTGDGLVGNPYLTITRAYQDVPYTLRHLVHIHVAAGAYTDWPQGINNRYEAAGRLSIDGTAAMVDVDAGPYTIDAGALVALGDSYAFDIPAVGGGLAPGAWDGLFIEWLDGTAVGRMCAIIENDATDIRIQGTVTMPSAGDKFKIVQPGAVVTLPAVDCVIDGDGDNRHDNTIAIAGMKIIASNKVTIQCKSLALPSCILNLGALTIYGCAINGGYQGSDTAFLDVPAIVGGYGIAAVITDVVGGQQCMYQGLGTLFGLTFLRSFDLAAGGLNVQLGAFKNTGGYGIDAFGRVMGFSTGNVYIEAKVTHGAIQLKDCATFRIDTLFVQEGLAAVYTKGICSGTISGLGGVDANVTNALLLANGSRVSIEAATCTLLGASGAGNEIKWSSGAANSAMPAANLEVNDALGAQVVGT